METSRDVVLVCDTKNEIDDQFAIAYALGSPNVRVLGVISSQNTMVHGRASVDMYHEEAQRIVTLSGFSEEVPCFRGARGPLETATSVNPSEGLEFLAELSQEGKAFSILATGPATDVASLRNAFPESKSVPLIWAGSFPNREIWERKKFGELNARADIQAWRALYSDPANLVILPGWPAVETVAASVYEIQRRLESTNAKVATYLSEILEEYSSAKGVLLDMDGERSMQKVLWDIVNVAYYSVPGALTCQESQLPEVDATGSMLWDRITGKALVCLDLDAQMILNDFYTSLEFLPD